jgi:hypothetical protein
MPEHGEADLMPLAGSVIVGVVSHGLVLFDRPTRNFSGSW